MPSLRFLKAENGANLFLLGKTGERFGTRPSELLRIDPDDPLALSIDIAADLHLRLLEAKEVERMNKEIEEAKHGHR